MSKVASPWLSQRRRTTRPTAAARRAGRRTPTTSSAHSQIGMPPASQRSSRRSRQPAFSVAAIRASAQRTCGAASSSSSPRPAPARGRCGPRSRRCRRPSAACSARIDTRLSATDRNPPSTAATLVSASVAPDHARRSRRAPTAPGRAAAGCRSRRRSCGRARTTPRPTRPARSAATSSTCSSSSAISPPSGSRTTCARRRPDPRPCRTPARRRGRTRRRRSW